MVRATEDGEIDAGDDGAVAARGEDRAGDSGDPEFGMAEAGDCSDRSVGSLTPSTSSLRLPRQLHHTSSQSSSLANLANGFSSWRW